MKKGVLEGGRRGGRKNKQGMADQKGEKMDREEEREERRKMAFFATCSVTYCRVRLTCNLPPCLAVTNCLCRPNRDCFTTI